MSGLAASVLTAGASLVWLAAMFVPLERVLPARPGQRILRRDAAVDLAFFFGQHLVFGAAVAGLVGLATGPAARAEVLEAPRAVVASLPLGVRVVAALVLGDTLAYFAHRLQHAVPFLWRFHSIHHTSEEVDWLAAHREHPLDGLYTQTAVNLPAILLGLDLGAVVGLVAFRSLFAIYVHSNTRLSLGPLRFVLGAPELHRTHHARDGASGNFANLAPWLDLMFGTYRAPAREPVPLGVPEPTPKGYFALLLHPFTRRSERPESRQRIEPATLKMGA